MTPTLHGRLAEHAEPAGDRVALVCDGRQVTYRQLDVRSTSSARALAAAGVRRGDRVAYVAVEHEGYYEILYACAKLGAVLVPVNWRLTAVEVGHILADSDSVLVFVDGTTGARRAVAEASPASRRTVVTMRTEGDPLAHWRPADLDDAVADHAVADDAVPDHALSDGEQPVVQLYTSGTTGLPKGVVLAHRSFFAVAEALRSADAEWIDWQPGDVSLIGIPGFHIGGLWWATQGLNAGVTNVSVRTFVSSEIARLVAEHQVSTTCVVPAMLHMLLEEPAAASGALRSLRKVVYGGAPISERLLTRCLTEIGCEFAQIYGLTETGNTAVCLPPAEHEPGNVRLRAAGRAYPGFGLRVVDDDGRPLPAGEVGEICLRTPARMVEYWRDVEATSRTLVGDWIHTGDAGYTDEEGFVFISDRIKDVIVIAGENVYPAEVEAALNRHLAVRECAVVARPDPRWGEVAHAVVVLEPDGRATASELSRWLRQDVADFKVPTSFEFLDGLPRNPSGKILRRSLRARFWAEASRAVN